MVVQVIETDLQVCFQVWKESILLTQFTKNYLVILFYNYIAITKMPIFHLLLFSLCLLAFGQCCSFLCHLYSELHWSSPSQLSLVRSILSAFQQLQDELYNVKQSCNIFLNYGFFWYRLIGFVVIVKVGHICLQSALTLLALLIQALILPSS